MSKGVHYRFHELAALDRQFKRIPHTPLGNLCRRMLERYAEPLLGEELRLRARCACGELVKHQTGPMGPRKHEPVCADCRRWILAGRFTRRKL